MTATQLVSLIDLTRLQEHDTAEAITALCQQAETPLGPVAAVCIYPEFVATARHALSQTHIPIATVANFPTGDDSLEATLTSIKNSLGAGAHEIDVVLPYKKLIAGETAQVAAFLEQCRAQTEGHPLKVIIESGALDKHHIIEATSLVAACGADFVKTSTGKIEQGASLEAVETILSVLVTFDNPPGIKISGGVRSIEQAQRYIELITQYMGPEWITPVRVRIGASKLLELLLA